MNWENFTPEKTGLKKPRTFYWDLKYIFLTNDILKAFIR